MNFRSSPLNSQFFSHLLTSHRGIPLASKTHHWREHALICIEKLWRSKIGYKSFMGKYKKAGRMRCIEKTLILALQNFQCFSILSWSLLCLQASFLHKSLTFQVFFCYRTSVAMMRWCVTGFEWEQSLSFWGVADIGCQQEMNTYLVAIKCFCTRFFQSGITKRLETIGNALMKGFKLIQSNYIWVNWITTTIIISSSFIITRGTGEFDRKVSDNRSTNFVGTTSLVLHEILYGHL